MRQELTNIFDVKVAPRVLIEASAGTGKTYTIVGLVVRMLLERDLLIDQVLIVTFTKKATAELRERILERLRECLDAIEQPGQLNDGDPYIAEITRRYGNSKTAAGKLRHAIHNFDDSQVFTIHGFCQKILQEEALMAGAPFEMRVSPTDELLLTAARDFWRVFMHRHSSSEAGRYLIRKLLSIASSPEELIGDQGIKSLLDKRYATIEGDFLEEPVSRLNQILELKQRVKSLWKAEKEEILDILRTCDISRYQTHIDKRIVMLEKWLNDTTFSEDAPGKLAMWTGSYLYDESNLKKDGQPVPRHDFFTLCSTFAEHVADIHKVESTLLKQAFEDISERRKKLASESEINSYNDLLTNVRYSLQQADYGTELAIKLRQRYPIALVDEFQDTDPVQYEIFESIYTAGEQESHLIMVGDPKQAIYAFRGADLHTYFRARRDGVGADYTLKENYRSTKGYIHAVNTLFKGNRRPFIEKEIEYPESSPGRKEYTDSLILEGKKQAPMTVIAKRGVESNKEQVGEFVFNQAVQSIGEILHLAENGKAFIGERLVRPGDIAILVSRHKDADTLKRKLKTIGVDAVTNTNQGIFDTLEASKIQILMNAVLNPVQSGSVHALLLTGLFGPDLEEMHQFMEDEERYQALSDELRDLQDLWYSRGFYATFYNLLHCDDRFSNLAKVQNAERAITNFFHLAELCAQKERDEGLSPRLLHRWLLRQMDEAEREEEKELQLESDQNLVKILTVHASKGLQFPLVFCPSLWLGRQPDVYKKTITHPVEYHKNQDNNLFINIEREKTDRRMTAEVQSAIESTAEEVRKAYVALTRAQVASFIFWGTHTATNFSGLGASFIGRDEVMKSIQNKYKVKEGADIDDETFISRFIRLENDSEGAVDLRVFDEPAPGAEVVKYTMADDLNSEPEWYQGRTELLPRKTMESFSSLSGHVSEPEEPDHDQVMDLYTEALQPTDGSNSGKDLTLFQFPRGATAGTAIHKLFELESFDFTKAGRSGFNFREQIEKVMDEYRFDRKWVPVLQQMLQDVSGSQIPGLVLRRLEQRDQLREMEFQFPAGSIEAEQLLETIRNGSGSAPPATSTGAFLTGFIDLVARQNNKYFILDYKSNYLGDSIEEYDQARLQHEIVANSYDLQYHLYTVALVKYLRKRVPDFTYETHVGGAAYLFVRGMKAGSDHGIWFHKPKRKVINKLEALLDNDNTDI